MQSSSDETRSVWLECLLQNGHEYGDEVETKDSLAVPENVKTHYKRFREILLIENNRSLYQSMPEIKKIIDSCKSEVSEEQHSEVVKNNIIKAIGSYLESNHMKNVVEYLNYSQNYYEMDNEDEKEEIVEIKMALTSNKFKRSSLLGVSSASTEFGYPNSGMLLRHFLSKHRLCVHTWLSEHRRLCPHDLVRANP